MSGSKSRSTAWRSIPLAIALLGAAVTPATVAGQAGASSPVVEVATFARDVAPILQRSCQICHQTASLGPMSLMTYEEVRPWAPLIREMVVTREMPPYHYDTDVGIQKLKHDRRLSAEEVATIVRWVEDGAPLGDLADLPPPVQWPDPTEWRLAGEYGQPDVVVRSAPFTVPAEGQDIWWQPVVPTGITEDRCILAMEVRPSVEGRRATHHANPSWRLLGADGLLSDQNAGIITEYALGKLGEIVPADACRTAPAGAWARWDVHYYPSGEAIEDDVVQLGLWFYPDGHRPPYRQTLQTYGLSGDIDLAPHGTAMTQGFHSFETPVRIDSFQPHGHHRLAAKSLEIFYPEENRRELVSMISNWNPGWHLSHIYEDDVAPLLPKGAVMIVTAWYDNTADNPYNPDPDQWVGRGSRTTDEMSHAWIAVTHLDEEGYRRILAERQARRDSDGLAGDR